MSALKKFSLKAAYLVRRRRGQGSHGPIDFQSPGNSAFDIVYKSDQMPQTVVEHSRHDEESGYKSMDATEPHLRVNTSAHLPTIVTEPGSILKHVKSIYSDGSSLADLSSISSTSILNEGQVRRENNNCAMYQVDSDWVTMISEPSDEPVNTMTTTGPTNDTPYPTMISFQEGILPKEVFHHRAGPSVDKGLPSGLFIHGQADVTQTPRARGSDAETDANTPRPTTQTVVSSEQRRWSDFSDLEFSDNSRRHIVQVQPGKWELVSEGSRHSMSHGLAPEQSRAWAGYSQGRYDRHDPNHFHHGPSGNRQVVYQTGEARSDIQSEAAGSESSSAACGQPIRYFAGSPEAMLYRSDPVRNPLWGAQNAHPLMNNLYAAVGQVATDFHATRLELEAMHHQTMIDSYRVESLRAQLAQSSLKIREQNVQIENLKVLASPRSGTHHNHAYVEKSLDIQEGEEDAGYAQVPPYSLAASVTVSSPLADPFTDIMAKLETRASSVDSAGLQTHTRATTVTPK
ncbi:hypothetical protein PV10_05825 [Exophiala mesophila]|uniref:Uncharacterized protein n=1 Tax=Exophiala mesophila TaxID=212818 RepID=A0A0D1XSZ7_EXOME|nr:uncharacterized protein PV10_05825 [Exophiala mesophila]KIV91266.1 hypothetical protein PV10_05825 [Exophiala mesophila]